MEWMRLLLHKHLMGFRITHSVLVLSGWHGNERTLQFMYYSLSLRIRVNNCPGHKLLVYSRTFIQLRFMYNLLSNR